MKKFLALIMLFSLPLFPQTSYHIAQSGNDANTGTQASPFATLEKLNGLTFHAGDSVLIKRGDTVYFGNTSITLPGTVAQPCFFGAYGTGARPVLVGDMTGSVWTHTTQFGVLGIWQTRAGNFQYGSTGFEDSAGTVWHLLKQNGDNKRFYMSNSDSLKAYLQQFTASTYGPGEACNGWDTIYVKTWDGNAPQVRIYRVNQFFGSFVTIRDINFERFKSQMICESVHFCPNISIYNCYFNHNRYISCFTYLCPNSTIDSCRVDSAGYTPIYTFGGSGHWQYDTVNYVSDTVQGTISGAEFSGVGIQQDTSSSFDHIVTQNVIMGNSFDTYFNVNDTVRNCNFINNHTAFISMEPDG